MLKIKTQQSKPNFMFINYLNFKSLTKHISKKKRERETERENKSAKLSIQIHHRCLPMWRLV